MQLPDDVLLIIREYSKPITRSDWRTCGRLPGYLFYTCLRSNWRKQVANHLYKRVFDYFINTQWGRIYIITRVLGIQHAVIHFETTIQELYKIPGVLHAQDYYMRGQWI